MSLFYTAADPKYPTFLSKNDVVSVNINQKDYKATVKEVKNDLVSIYIDDLNLHKDVSMKTLKIIERDIEKVGINKIKIQINDLVSYVYNKQSFDAIVRNIDVAKKQVQISIINRSSIPQYVDYRSLRFCAKGNIFNLTYNTPLPQNTLSQMRVNNPNRMNPMTQYSNNGLNFNQVQTNSGMSYNPNAPTVEAILVDAPCVVKVVPFDTNPDDYDDLMSIHALDGDQEVPSILPLVRMKCGTILVVRAPPE